MTQAFVLDCSVTMAWFFNDECTPETDRLLDQLNDGGKAHVAQHWFLEVANTLLTGERRKRCTPTDSSQFIALLEGLSIETDPSTASNAMLVTLGLARSYALTIYDAAYLEVAMRLKLPLATLDRELRHAAMNVGVDSLP